MGLNNNIRKAVAPNVFKAILPQAEKRVESNQNEHMITARITEGDNPVRKANPHKNTITINSRSGFKPRHLFHNGERKNSSKAEMKPICSPESAST